MSNDCLDFYAVIGAAKKKKEKRIKKSCCTNIFVCIHFLRFVYASALFTLFSVDSECCEDSPFVVSLCLQSSRWYFMDLLFLFFFLLLSSSQNNECQLFLSTTCHCTKDAQQYFFVWRYNEFYKIVIFLFKSRCSLLNFLNNWRSF